MGVLGVVQIRARSDPYAALKRLCQSEIDRVNGSPAWVVYCDPSRLTGRPSATHVNLQRRVASYAVEMQEGQSPPLGILRFEIAKARTSLEKNRTLEEAKADDDFEAAFTEEHETPIHPGGRALGGQPPTAARCIRRLARWGKHLALL